MHPPRLPGDQRRTKCVQSSHGVLGIAAGGSGSRITQVDDPPAHRKAWAFVSLWGSVLPYNTLHLPEHPSAPTLTSHLAQKRLLARVRTMGAGRG